MATLDRRTVLAGAATLASTPALAQAGRPQRSQTVSARMYDYLFMDFAPPAGTPLQRVLTEQFGRAKTAALEAAGGTVVGAWTSQLGWKSSEAAILVGWRDGAARNEGALASLTSGPIVRSLRRDRLVPTVRPQSGSKPQPGGIYVHRWFAVKAAAIPEFVELSVLGWRDFETRFETSIYGLLQAERSAEDLKDGLARLLLITRYRDHGVWETSRDPSTDAMAAFARRQKLTRSTWGASSLLLPTGG
jgi:hypothetical protein